MNDIKTIEIGEGNHNPTNCPLNRLPIAMELCSDSRKDKCRYCVKIMINTKHIAFSQYFCSWDFRKK